MNKKEKYMLLALELARKAKERTYPNPMVGALIVKGGKVLGRGYHAKAGESHAEVKAIHQAGNCSGAEMFVTLEPCDHFGKTPPCTQAIIDSGIKAVNIAMKDPNPINSGRGIKRLKKAGIKVSVGLCREEAGLLNRKYIKFITTELPYVTVKLAQSIDGKIAATDGSSKWISSASSRKFTRDMRKSFDAILVGSGTLLKDDPFLLDEKRKGYKTKRVIVDTSLKVPLRSNILKTLEKSPVIIGTTDLAPQAKLKKLRKLKGLEVISVEARGGKVPLGKLLRALAKRNIVNLLVEGGGEIAGSLMDEGLVDEAMFFISPKIIGGNHSSVKGRGARSITEALKMKNIEIKSSGSDIFVRGEVCSRG